MDKNKGKVIIHYQREDQDYKNWSLWLWEFPQGEGKEFLFNGKDSFGITATYPLSSWSKFVLINNLGVIIKSIGSWDKKDGSDKIVKFYKMAPDKKGNYHVYLKDNDEEVYANEKLDKVSTFSYAKFTDFKTIEAKLNDLVIEYNVKRNGEIIDQEVLKEATDFLSIKLHDEISLDYEYILEVKLKKNNSLIHKRVRFYDLYKTKKFARLYEYDGELGAICDKDSTTFKVWSPVSKKIILRVYKNGTPCFYDAKKGNDEIIIEQEMEKGKNGVFSTKIFKNLHGFYYTYVVTNDAYKGREIVDIYAKSTGVNGFRGMVVDFSKIDGDDLSKIKPYPYCPRSLTVYEAHIADITSSKTWTNDPEKRKLEKTFLGACLEGTTYLENGITVKTGFDHIKELGVNAIQLLPIFDHANDEAHMKFNFGYNPVNYNVLEGGYSTNPYDGEVRIKEFKHFVKKYHEAGINVIMDVVYNHLNGATGSNFDVLMPGYYFRYVKDYVFSNGSGCGNETASEMPMYRKFIVDSVMFLAKEYKLGGFRFDLMAIHDIDTMNEVVKQLHEFDKNIVVYGEPWSGGNIALPYEKSCIKENSNKFKGFGFFSDAMRDSLAKASKNIHETGWCVNSVSESRGEQYRIMEGIKGTTFGVDDPNKVVNYASCHDNRTIYDRIKFDGITSEKEAQRIAMLANAIVFTSNGITLMLSGEEMLRSKKGSDNSYNLAYEVNELNYALKVKNISVFRNYQKLIKFKQNCGMLSLDKGDNTKLNVNINEPNVISYEFEDKRNGKAYKVFHVNGYKSGRPVLVNLEGYSLLIDTINPYKDLSRITSLISYETLVAYKNLK